MGVFWIIGSRTYASSLGGPLIIRFQCAKEMTWRASRFYEKITTVLAVSSGLVISDRDLYEYMGVPVDMRFKEYREQVRRCFEEYSYSGAEIDAYFSKTKTLELLIESFEGYTRYGVAGYEPPAVASCLDMMY